MAMYTDKDFKSKKQLKEAVAAYNAGTGREVTYYQPGPFGGKEIKDGTICCEGPHYPKPHTWYATCTVQNGVIVKVK